MFKVLIIVSSASHFDLIFRVNFVSPATICSHARETLTTIGVQSVVRWLPDMTHTGGHTRPDRGGVGAGHAACSPLPAAFARTALRSWSQTCLLADSILDVTSVPRGTALTLRLHACPFHGCTFQTPLAGSLWTLFVSVLSFAFIFFWVTCSLSLVARRLQRCLVCCAVLCRVASSWCVDVHLST